MKIIILSLSILLSTSLFSQILCFELDESEKSGIYTSGHIALDGNKLEGLILSTSLTTGEEFSLKCIGTKENNELIVKVVYSENGKKSDPYSEKWLLIDDELTIPTDYSSWIFPKLPKVDCEKK